MARASTMLFHWYFLRLPDLGLQAQNGQFCVSVLVLAWVKRNVRRKGFSPKIYYTTASPAKILKHVLGSSGGGLPRNLRPVVLKVEHASTSALRSSFACTARPTREAHKCPVRTGRRAPRSEPTVDSVILGDKHARKLVSTLRMQCSP